MATLVVLVGLIAIIIWIHFINRLSDILIVESIVSFLPVIISFILTFALCYDLNIDFDLGLKSFFIFAICMIGSSSLGSLFISWKQSTKAVHTDSNQAGFLKKYGYIMDVVGLIGAIASIASFYLEHIKRWFGW